MKHPLGYNKCPKCGSRYYRTSQTGAKIVIRRGGKVQTRTQWVDAGTFECFKCGYKEDI